MWRLLHVVAIAALVGSAVYAYSVKYETIFFAERILKIKHKIAGEHDQIAMLRADWAQLTRPERMQALVLAHLDTQPLSLDQIVRVTDIPDRAPKVDGIGHKLDALGLGAPTNTPRVGKASAGATPPTTAR
jgi:hypothetical protein